MNEAWEFTWAISIRVTPFLIGLSGAAMNIRLACSPDYPILLNSLSRSVALTRLKWIWGEQGFYSRLSLVNSIASLVFFPQHFIRRGLLDPEDIERIPQHIKKNLNVSTWLLLIGVLWIMCIQLII